jgi:hypothetical protein
MITDRGFDFSQHFCVAREPEQPERWCMGLFSI